MAANPEAATARSRSYRQFLSSLTSALPSATATHHSPTNPLKDVSAQDRNIFLTLYVLFEKELLPALDLLDRGLVTRLLLQSSKPVVPNSNDIEVDDDADDVPVTHPDRAANPDPDRSTTSILLVRSAQQQQQTSRTYEHVNCYEVRLDAWNCSCPAFAFSAFPAAAAAAAAAASADLSTSSDHDAAHEQDSGLSIFGGLARDSKLPICKHLLACVLATHCDMFAHLVVEREASAEEIAAWAAGWGD